MAYTRRFNCVKNRLTDRRRVFCQSVLSSHDELDKNFPRQAHFVQKIDNISIIGQIFDFTVSRWDNSSIYWQNQLIGTRFYISREDFGEWPIH